MGAEAQEWMLSFLFAALGLALGSLLSSAYPAIVALSTAQWPFLSKKKIVFNCSGLVVFREVGIIAGLCLKLHMLDQKKIAFNSSEVSQDSSVPKLDDHGGYDVHGRELVIQASISSKESATANGDLKPDPFNPSKRQGYLSWDDYFMAIAFLSAHRSKDPNRQVGACLVSQDRVILGIGYNGFPRGCSDDVLPWAKMSVDGDPLHTKYPYVCHAEVNAILNKNHASACGQRLYVTMFPCNECAKIIIQAGVAEVVYFVGKNSSADCSYVASRKLLAMAGVKVWQHQPAQKKVILDFK